MSSRNNSLNHVLDWEEVFDQCKTHKDNYSDKDSKCNLLSVKMQPLGVLTIFSFNLF